MPTPEEIVAAIHGTADGGVALPLGTEVARRVVDALWAAGYIVEAKTIKDPIADPPKKQVKKQVKKQPQTFHLPLAALFLFPHFSIRS